MVMAVFTGFRDGLSNYVANYCRDCSIGEMNWSGILSLGQPATLIVRYLQLCVDLTEFGSPEDLLQYQTYCRRTSGAVACLPHRSTPCTFRWARLSHSLEGDGFSDRVGR